MGKTYFYLKNGYGVELFKVQIENPNLHLVIVVIANRKAMSYKLSFHWKKLKRCNDPSFPNRNIDWVGDGRRAKPNDWASEYYRLDTTMKY